MTLRRWCAIAAGSACFSAADAQQQPKIPIRQLAIEATSTESIRTPLIQAWQWPDGSIVVTHRNPGGRLLVFDKDFKLSRVIADSSLIAIGLRPFGQFIAMPYAGDTTVVVDPGNSALIFLDRNGKQTRLVALPRGADGHNISTGFYGQFIDPKGRIVYRGTYPRETTPAAPIATPGTHDSMAVVRADYDRHGLDTFPVGVRQQLGALNLTPRTADSRGTVKMIPNTGLDYWSMLADGTIAVVRYHDYHIDWIYPDGSRASTPKMPFDWRRLTDEEKQARIDTMRTVNERSDRMRDSSMARLRTSIGEGSLSPLRVYATLAEVPDYFPPISGAYAVNPDADNRLWIAPSTSLQAQGGVLMDVVSKKGIIEERVQLPPNAAIAGFGPNGVVFLRMVQPDRTNLIARARIVR